MTLTAPCLHDGSKTELKEAVRSRLTHQVGAKAADADLTALTAFLATRPSIA